MPISLLHVAVLLFSETLPVGPHNRPNVVVFLLDDVGHGDFGYTGHPLAKTPFIDGFARTATRLTTLYAGAPICSPSRAALLSGRYADAVGVWDLVTPGASEMQLLPDALVLGNVLAQGGYACGQIGKWHVSHDSPAVGLSAYGFESIRPSHGYAVAQVITIMGWMQRQLNASLPFFLYWDPHECHEPVAQRSPEKFRFLYGKPMVRPPSNFSATCSMLPNAHRAQPYCNNRTPLAHRKEGSCDTPGCAPGEQPCARPARNVDEQMGLQRAKRQSWSNQRTYLGCISQADAAFGKLLRFLRRSGIESDTLVLLASDNGPELRRNKPAMRRDCFGSAAPFRGSKASVFEGGIRVPGLVRWLAGGVGSLARAELHEPVHFVDVLPTLAEAAGIQLPDDAAERLHGVSILRLLRKSMVPSADSPAVESDRLSRPFPLYWTSHAIPGYARNDDACERCDCARYAIRVGRWKLIAWAEPYNCRPTPMDYITGAMLLANGTQLYDLHADHAEEHDLASEQPERTAWMLRMLVRTRAAVQANGPRWDLNCQLPTGKLGVTIYHRLQLKGMCHCMKRDAKGSTIAERHALAIEIQRSRHPPRPLLIISPPHVGSAKVIQMALSVHPLVVGIDGELLNAMGAKSVPDGSAVLPAQRARPAGVELFNGNPLCAFAFPAQLAARTNASARATQAVLAIRHGGLVLSSIKIDGNLVTLANSLPTRVSLRASAEEVFGPIHATGAPCVDHSLRAIGTQRDDATLSTQADPLVKALASAGTIALLVVRRDREAHWCELTSGVQNGMRAARCAAHANSHSHGGPFATLQTAVGRSAELTRYGTVSAAKQRLHSGGSVYRKLVADAAQGDLHLTVEQFAVEADAEDAAAIELLRIAGIEVGSVSAEIVHGIAMLGRSLDTTAPQSSWPLRAAQGELRLLCSAVLRHVALSSAYMSVLGLLPENC